MDTKDQEFELAMLDGIRVAKDWLDLYYKVELKPDIRAAKVIEVAMRLCDQICVLGLRRHFENDSDIATVVSKVKLSDSRIKERSINRYALAGQTPRNPEIVAKLVRKYDEDVGSAMRKSWNKKTIGWRKM